ncbi:BN159_2729 family protein [Streptomyces sp. DSM 3412]|uniref:BN159_2729 family protein n=1 Tax=Streptomyces gottesmaniae TaxID=3075518 RepID=A0ABU2YU68_9ACTN|nr:BN159_2729 family protein [Streptomyces sp. DSM 3412]MDT0567866.1 BN159_2729 family protein [Streptomyces sp. DSM 3412]
MNKNFPHAVRVIRAALASAANDPAAAIAQALNEARLLVDPERSYGTVLHRTAAGGWSQDPQAQPHPERELTDLEQQAVAWDQSRERARLVAAAIQQHAGQHPAFQSIRTDGDRVLVALQITGQAQWSEWRRYFGITHDAERPMPHAVGGDGYRDGVRVSVVAYDVPQVRARAAQAAKRPFLVDGVVYDLALPQRDSNGDVWYFQGQQTEDGMPLMSADGRPERCSLANIVAQVGPLLSVRTPVTPIAAKGGETA